jgi:hypothetical protein
MRARSAAERERQGTVGGRTRRPIGCEREAQRSGSVREPLGAGRDAQSDAKRSAAERERQGTVGGRTRRPIAVEVSTEGGAGQQCEDVHDAGVTTGREARDDRSGLGAVLGTVRAADLSAHRPQRSRSQGSAAKRPSEASP